MRTTNFKIIHSEYSSKNNWKDIYQWKRVASKGNTEKISELLLRDFHKIKWSASGLRDKDFRIPAHKGYCQINTPITQFTEKRFCRALFNEYSIKPHILIGKVIDYEVPLTAPNQKRKTGKKINQGDIDLIAKKNNELLFIEAKKSKSQESLLKAILEIFVYSIRLSKYKFLSQLKKEYNHTTTKKIVPCILVFKDSTSGKQLCEINKYPELLKLIEIINTEFVKHEFNSLRFFCIEKPNNNYENVLKTLPVTSSTKQKQIKLNKNVEVIQYFPSYCSNSKLFQKKLNNNMDTILLEMLLRSYLLYDKQNAIKYITLRINSFQDKIDSYNKTYPKNKILTKEIQEFVRISIPFIDAYLIIAKDYIFSEFLDINLRLLNPYRNKILVPIISNFKTEKTLNILIDSYQNIRKLKSKDYDGISSKEKDIVDESIIISALCNFESNKIVPLLKESLLAGAIGDTKSKVVNKLLEFVSKQEILDFMPDFNNPDTWMIQALTNKKENTDWVKNYLNKR